MPRSTEICAAAQAGNKEALYTLLNSVKDKAEKSDLLRDAMYSAGLAGNTVLVEALSTDMNAPIADALCGAVAGKQTQLVHDILSKNSNLIPLASYCAIKYKCVELEQELNTKWKPDYNRVAYHAVFMQDLEVLDALLESEYTLDMKTIIGCVVNPQYYDRNFAIQFQQEFKEIPVDFMLKKAHEANNADCVMALVPAVLEEHVSVNARNIQKIRELEAALGRFSQYAEEASRSPSGAPLISEPATPVKREPTAAQFFSHAEPSSTSNAPTTSPQPSS
ncbi:hypothetical protein ACFORL_00125 [Legionella dresdenensis]|uniref:Ankyrin repeats (3 copies) n=1 Tax=Legionella dresdenensis TaxID=450200 RepID=A0ABV8CBL0_9GAMM